MARVRHHFFDPANGGSGLSFLGIDGDPSRTWALADPVHNPGNIFTYEDAKQYLLTGLLSTDRTERQRNFYMMFASLGHVVHLIQDLAQPQHTKNEYHGPLVGSIIEEYTKNVAGSLQFSGYDPGLLAGRKPQELWSRPDSTGLADFSNRNFVTPGNNFLGTLDNIQHSLNYAEPDGTGAVVQSVSVDSLRTECAGIPSSLHGNLTFVGTPVRDFLTNTSSFNPRSSTNSIWSVATPTGVVRGLGFSYNIFNACAAVKFLLPRAAAYSSALINHFFRGSLALSPPDSEIISIVDHSAFVSTYPLTGFHGFNTVRLKVRNNSQPPQGSSAPETMGAGTLHAVFRFRRNTCYSDDLTGEPGGPNNDPSSTTSNPNTCRSPNEETVVSSPLSATIGTQDQEVVFNFPQELPINATDVYLQVVYEGPLGSESNAVVVSSFDVSEPSFIVGMNDKDYIAIAGVVYTRAEVNASQTLLAQIQPRECVDYSQGFGILKESCFQPQPLDAVYTFSLATAPLVQITQLQPQHFVRIAYLGNGSIVNGQVTPITMHVSGSCNPADKPVTPKLYTDGVDELTGQKYLFIGPLVSSVRGVYTAMAQGCVWDGGGNAGGISGSRLGPLPSANLAPIPVQITLPP